MIARRPFFNEGVAARRPYAPNAPEPLNDLAWLLATDADAWVRNGAEVVRLAERACPLTQYVRPPFIGALAPAHAEAGKFNEAIEAANKASELALMSQNAALAQINQKLGELYRNHQPYHQSR